MGRWRWWLEDLRHRIWFRAAVLSAAAVLLALGGGWVAPIIPYELAIKVGGKGADALLSILATSMLAVTTFSLTAMVTAFSGASQQITPRAVHLLIEDRTAQNALSTFLGGFVFALVSIVALTLGFYGPEGRVILFVGSIVMAAVIVITLLRWIARLVHFGRVEDAIKRIEEKSSEALASYAGTLLLVGHPLPTPVSPGRAVMAGGTGYVHLIDREDLSSLASKCEVGIVMQVASGDFVDPSTPVAVASVTLVGEDADALADTVSVTRRRDFNLDPRFGMEVLAEIAVRALSPAVNDPGTAIEVINAAQRVLQAISSDRCKSTPLPHVTERPLSFEEMVELILLPVGRDGAAFLEVGGKLQQMLASLAAQLPETRPFLARVAGECLERSRSSPMSKADLARLERVHSRLFPSA